MHKKDSKPIFFISYLIEMKLRNSQKQETIVTERKTKSKVYRKYQIDAKKI